MARPFWLLALATLFLSFSCRPSTGQKVATVSPDSLLLRGVAIVDPTSGTLSQPRDILIQAGKIIQITPRGNIDGNRVAQTFSAEGLFAFPGLIDVHAHIGDGGLGYQTQTDRQAGLTQFVRYGVTTIFVPGGGGGNDDQLASWKQRCASGELLGPAIFGSGAIVTAPGSHPIGTLWNMTADTDPALVYERGAVALGEDQPAGPLLDQKIAKGIDALKIVIEDGPGPWYPKPRLSKRKIAELATAAHQRGLRVFAHISTATHVADGVAAGIDGIMHSAEDVLPQPLLKEMADKGIFYVPTLALYDGFFRQAQGRFEEEAYAVAGVSQRALASLNSPEWRNQPSDPLDWVAPTQRALATNLRGCVTHGVPIALGTDVNNPTVFPGYSAHEELALMVAAGLTPAQALRTATTGGAAFLGLDSELGKIEAGYQADLILLTGNPLVDIRNTRTLRAVVLDGRLIEQVVSSADL